MRLVDVYESSPIKPWVIYFLYLLLAERPPEANISHKQMPTLEQHRQFVYRCPYEAWYLIEPHPATQPVGAIYLSKQREVGIAIRAEDRGKGYGSQALAELRKLHLGPLLANVAPGNAASRAFFEKHGGRMIQVTYEL